MKSFKEFILSEETDEKFKPPAGAKAEAKQAIEWKEKYGDEVNGGTRIGWIRARQLADGDELSLDIVKRMHSFFSRHQKNKAVAPEHRDEPWCDAGLVAWKIWGGDAGATWAKEIVDRIKKKETGE